MRGQAVRRVRDTPREGEWWASTTSLRLRAGDAARRVGEARGTARRRDDRRPRGRARRDPQERRAGQERRGGIATYVRRLQTRVVSSVVELKSAPSTTPGIGAGGVSGMADALRARVGGSCCED